MQQIKKYTPFFASALLMCGVLFFIYPHYQYYVDPDDTAYLTISKRYASGDIQRAINGYWSPWACWLTAGLIRQGFEAILAGVIVNTVGGIGFLYISQSFFLRFDIKRNFQWLLNITLALFLCYAVFWQSFDDLWECLFLLSALRLMLVEYFVKKPVLWVVCGIVGTLAYFAKAYSFPFFILNTIVCTYFLSKDSKGRWVIVAFVTTSVMALCSLPWIYALHNKYGIWTTSTSGSLNMSWYLVGHPYWKDGIKVLIPPAYPDSPYYWEDPWFANGATPHFWDSWHLFGLQFLRIGLNIWKFITSSFQLSVFFIVVVGYVKWMLFWKHGVVLAKDQKVLMLSLLLFTVGYLPINYEARYLWYMVALCMVIGTLYIQRMERKGFKEILPYVFALSFLVWPVWGMIEMYDEGSQEHDLAVLLHDKGIKGTFTSDATPGAETQRMIRLAYFSGNPFYVKPFPRMGWGSELKRYGIRYYIVSFYDGGEDDMAHRIPVDEQGKPYPCVLDERSANCQLLNKCLRIAVFRLY